MNFKNSGEFDFLPKQVGSNFGSWNWTCSIDESAFEESSECSHKLAARARLLEAFLRKLGSPNLCRGCREKIRRRLGKRWCAGRD